MNSTVVTTSSERTRRVIVDVLDDCELVAGVGALIIVLRFLFMAARPPDLGLGVLALLALIVRAYPFGGRHSRFVATASTPLLAIMALYGPQWATAVGVATLIVDGVVRGRLRLDLEQLVRSAARATLAMALAGATFTVMGAHPGSLDLALTLPALSAAEIVLVLLSWLMTAPLYALDTPFASYRELWRETLLGILPAVAAEPVLALVLAVAAGTPEPTTMLAAVLPLAGLMLALRVHTDMRRRLQRAYGALNRAHEQLRIQATTDPLTGLANRRLFEEMLAARLDEAARHGRPLSVLLLDLDGFKRINDTYGHAAGDAVLIAVAGALKKTMRRSDLPARLAGDEFVALLPETDGKNALKLAERVCAAVADLKVSVGDTIVRPSASVGAASTDRYNGIAAEGLLAAADGAAYAAKAAGKCAARLAPGHAPKRQPPVRKRPAAARPS